MCLFVVCWCYCSCFPSQGNNGHDVDFDDDDDDDFDLSSLDEEGYQDFARPKYSVIISSFVKPESACYTTSYVRSPIIVGYFE